MSEQLSNKTCIEFTEVLASKAPVPGGGGVAALVGALGSALCSMVGNYTTGKKKYACYEEDIQRMLKEGEEIQKNLLACIDKDAQAFEPLSKAYAIPKDAPNRQEILDQASVDACQAPLEMMRNICRSIDLLEEMHIKGSVMLASDVGCGALCSRAALECASMNIFINTKYLPEKIKQSLEEETIQMLDTYIPKAEETAKLVMAKLRG
ncbi:MAG: cyclodeaminase/cyclohydrolase family protein [Firmicutes bacterium]|nr:cyclodeaminase/cyclohydrolase family protein [Bacillota bacterium]